MDDLLRKSTGKLTDASEDLLRPVCTPALAVEKVHNSLQTPGDAREALQSKPDIDFLVKILQWLFRTSIPGSTFNIKVPGPQAAQIINALVNETVPDYWDILKRDDAAVYAIVRRLLLGCLTSLSGIGALIARLRSLINQRKRTGEKNPSVQKPQTSDNHQPFLDVINILETILQKDDAIDSMWRDLHSSITKPAQLTLLWKEVISVIATGRLLSVVAEANEIVNNSNSSLGDGSWVGNGRLYALWLGRNVSFMACSDKGELVEKSNAIAQLFSRALTLGYTGKRYP